MDEISMTLLDEIEAYLERTGVSAKAFARAAGCGSSLVYEMRKRSDPMLATLIKVREYLDGSVYAAPRYNRQPQRINTDKLIRIDGRACFNCGAAYARCDCHRPIEILSGVSLCK